MGYTDLFFDSPGSVKADEEEIALSIGRDPHEVQPVLAFMHSEGLLSSLQVNDKTLFAGNTGHQSYQTVTDFFKYTATREGRLKIIYYITERRFYRK